MRTVGNASSALRKGAWTAEEDMLLKNCIEKFGEGKWHLVPFKAGLNRCRKSCRLRWLNYLRPNIKRGDFGEDEVDLMQRLHKLLGNRWSLIAGRIPGRTANDVKNYWNTHLRSRSKQQKEEHKDNDSVTVIKPKPWAFSKILTHQNPQTAADNDDGNHVINLTGSLDDGVNHAINISLGLVSNPGQPDDKINKYLKEIDDDVEWPFGGFSMGREEFYVGEQGDDIDCLFDLSKDDISWVLENID